MRHLPQAQCDDKHDYFHDRLGPDVLVDEGKQGYLDHRLDHAVEVLLSTLCSPSRLVVLQSTPLARGFPSSSRSPERRTADDRVKIIQLVQLVQLVQFSSISSISSLS